MYEVMTVYLCTESQMYKTYLNPLKIGHKFQRFFSGEEVNKSLYRISRIDGIDFFFFFCYFSETCGLTVIDLGKGHSGLSSNPEKLFAFLFALIPSGKAWIHQFPTSLQLWVNKRLSNDNRSLAFQKIQFKKNSHSLF